MTALCQHLVGDLSGVISGGTMFGGLQHRPSACVSTRCSQDCIDDMVLSSRWLKETMANYK